MLAAEAAIPVTDLDYMRQGFTGNDAACNPELQFANLIWLISVLMFTVPSTKLCYDAAHMNETVGHNEQGGAE